MTDLSHHWDAGMWGLAILRQWPDVDPALLQSARCAFETVDPAPTRIEEIGQADGYAAWASTYGKYETPLTTIERPVIQQWTADLPQGSRVLDAGCGTGRHALPLSDWHTVIGVDSSAHMLAEASNRSQALGRDIDWRDGDLTLLPVPTASQDLALCALAIGHAPLLPVIAELARVVRTEGRIIITELHPMAIVVGGHPMVPVADGVRVMKKHPHRIADYLGAFRAHSLDVFDMREVPYTAEALRRTEVGTGDATVTALTGWPGLLAWNLIVR